MCGPVLAEQTEAVYARPSIERYALRERNSPDYSTVVAQVARTLRPGGRFVHIGVHPCFVGAFADWHDPQQVVIDNGYADRSYRFDSWTPHGVRARVRAWHTPLPDLLNAVTAAGLRLHRLAEDAPRGVPARKSTS